MTNDPKKKATDDTSDYNFHTLDDQQDNPADVDDTDIDAISQDILDGRDAPANEDEVSLSQLAEDEGEDDDDENNKIENLHHPGIDDDTE